MDLRGLLFDVGHRVTGRGRLLRDAEGDWLDPNSVVLSRGGVNCRSGLAVRLLGVDLATTPAVVDESDPRPSSVVVTGVWLGDAIQVETLEAHQSTDRKTPELTTPPARHRPTAGRTPGLTTIPTSMSSIVWRSYAISARRSPR
jgi:hypothetical protein